ncbi:MAG TPA: NAD-dependent epimerase/dehydratase family protein [Chryseolinea sp.]|nr:NAD-dependent epimerase/dehydratase family protein [Chryseolinea sp.]
MRTALIAGGTGLIGNQLLHLLLTSNRYEKVIAIVRKDLPDHPKLIQVTLDMANIASYAAIRADDIFCCLGTTIGKAGSKDKFREVDFLYPLNLAKAMRANGATQYLLVSSLGASQTSAIFYNKTKGEAEAEITNIGFETLHIFRPSLLLGHRIEKRSGEDAAKFVYKIFGWLIPSKYQAIDSLKVATAMLHFASLDKKGIFIHESEALQVF